MAAQDSRLYIVETHQGQRARLSAGVGEWIETDVLVEVQG